MNSTEIEKNIKLDNITVDDALQVREYIDGDTVEAYGSLMKSNGPLGALDVFRIGDKYLLANGWHRLEAARALGWTEIGCNIHKGDRRAALLFAAGANATHGQPLSRAEKTRAAEKLLADDEWFQWSDRKIAKHIGVTAPTIGRARERVLNELGQAKANSSGGDSLKKSYSDNRKRVDKHGNVSTIDTKNIGRKSRSQEEQNLTELNAALDTLARLPFDASYAVETFGSRITDNDDAAIEWVAEFGEVKSRAA